MDQENTVLETTTTRLGQRLRRARLARNLTQGEVARNQFSVSYVSAVERGQIRPSLGALEKLADRLQVPVTDLLGSGSLDKLGITYGESREANAERFREEIDQRLREAQILLHQGNAAAALELLRRASNQQLSTRESLMIQLTTAACHVAMGNGDDARRVASDALSQAERIGDRDTSERLRNALGDAYALLRNYQMALEQYRACLNAIGQGYVQDPAFRVVVLFNIGTQYGRLDDHENAVEFLRQATQSARDVVNPERLGAAYWSLSSSLSARGDNTVARLYAARSLGAYEEARNRRLVGQVYTRLGREFAQAGQVDDALAELQAAYQIAAGQQDARGVAETQRSLAAVYLAEGRFDDAARAAADALEQSTNVSNPADRAESLITLAQVQERQNEFAKAERSFDEAIEALGSA
ncbi:MAG TPA: helix-turn-helix transcriptional regulator, partial [Ktedonobacterales bacterium]|nr:helix-turn-helix transcriptional regulator [Ktedonobacterales bacterium]